MGADLAFPCFPTILIGTEAQGNIPSGTAPVSRAAWERCKVACKIPASLEDTTDSSDPGEQEPHTGASLSQTALEIKRVIIIITYTELLISPLPPPLPGL